MSKKKNLLNLFTQDVTYNYHLIETKEPVGHLIYLIKNGSKLEKDTLEFSPTKIAEELIDECSVKVEKFAPGIFFSEESSTEKLKYELNDKLAEDTDFSAFIETVKDEYRILEVKDSLLYKFDPESYNAEKQKEHEAHQKELWDEAVQEMTEKNKKRENAILKYNNDFAKLLKEYLQDIIEYEKRDFDLIRELEKIVGNLIDSETWIKIEEKPFICRIEPISLETETMNVFLTDNDEYSYTATLRFDKTVLVTENVVRINKGDEMPIFMPDYLFLAQLFDVDLTNVPEWEYKNDTDRFEYVVDYLAPIFKIEKDKKKKELINKILAAEAEQNDTDDEDDDSEDDEDEDKPVKYTHPSDYYFDVDENDAKTISLVKIGYWNKNKHFSDQLGSHSLSQNVITALDNAGIYGKSEVMESVWEVIDEETKTKEEIIKSMENEGFIYLKDANKIAMGGNFNNNNTTNNTTNMKQPKDYYFDVFVGSDIDGTSDAPSCICLSEDGHSLDDQLGSHSLSQPCIDALNRAGIFGDAELMEAVWEVNDYENKSKEEIIESMEIEGFVYSPGIMG